MAIELVERALVRVETVCLLLDEVAVPENEACVFKNVVLLEFFRIVVVVKGMMVVSGLLVVASEHPLLFALQLGVVVAWKDVVNDVLVSK